MILLGIPLGYKMPSIFRKEFFQKIINIFPKITGEIFIYGLGGSLAQFVGLVTIPIITRIFSSAEFGTVDVINATSGYFAVLITLNIGSGLMRHFYEISTEAAKDRQKMVSSLVWFTIIFGGLVVFLGSLLSSNLSQLLFSRKDYALAISLALASLPFASLKEIFASVLRMQRKPINFLVLNILYAIINFLLTLLFVLGFKWGINGFFAAQIVSGVFISLASAWQCRDFVRFAFSKKWFYSMASYGVPMLPGSLLNWGMMSINRILLTQFTTESQIAYFSVATKTAKVIELAVTAFIMGWLPVFLANINSESFHKKLDKVLRYYIYATLSLSALVTIFAKELFYVLAPPEYQVGSSLVALLCLKQAITGTTYIFTVGIVQSKKTYLVSVSTGIGIITTVLISLLLSPHYGIFGAAIADAVGILVYAILTFIFSNHLKKLGWDIKPIIWAPISYLFLWLLSIIIGFPNLYADLLFRVGLLGLFLFFVFVIIDRSKLLKTLLTSITH